MTKISNHGTVDSTRNKQSGPTWKHLLTSGFLALAAMATGAGCGGGASIAQSTAAAQRGEFDVDECAALVGQCTMLSHQAARAGRFDDAVRFGQSGCYHSSAEACEAARDVYGSDAVVYVNLATATERSLQLCDRGNEWACFDLGNIYAYGPPTIRSVQSALGYLERACEDGVASACAEAAKQRQGQDASPALVVDLIEQSCLLGDPVACTDAARAYFVDNEIPADAGRAWEYAIRACDQDSSAVVPEACWMAGLLRTNGDGVQQDQQDGRGLMSQACDGGWIDACYELGTMQHGGVGGRVDTQGAAESFTSACSGVRIVPAACTTLGMLYFDGTGVATDAESGVEFLQQGCANGDARGCSLLAGLFEQGVVVEASPSHALAYYVLACQAGGADDCSTAGAMFYGGTGAEADTSRAMDLFEIACLNGSMNGCYNLAALFDRGDATPPYAAYTQELYRQACEGGYERACEFVR